MRVSVTHRNLRVKTPLALFICPIYILYVTNASTAQKGRGAGLNPTNRFEKISFEKDIDWNSDDDRPLRTEFYRDTTQSVINYNNSPDVGFDASLNPYRGLRARLRLLLSRARRTSSSAFPPGSISRAESW